MGTAEGCEEVELVGTKGWIGTEGCTGTAGITRGAAVGLSGGCGSATVLDPGFTGSITSVSRASFWLPSMGFWPAENIFN